MEEHGTYKLAGLHYGTLYHVVCIWSTCLKNVNPAFPLKRMRPQTEKKKGIDGDLQTPESHCLCPLHLSCASKTIEPASAASQNATLAALVDVLRQDVEAFLALVAPLAAPPSVMRALVVLDQVVPLPLDENLLPRCVYRFVAVVSVDDDVGPGKQPIFVPLGAAAVLPLNTTGVAELCAAEASCVALALDSPRGRDGGKGWGRLTHVVTAGIKLDHSSARLAPLPTVLSSDAKDLLCSLILRTIVCVRWPLAYRACLDRALGARRGVFLNEGRIDECRTGCHVAIGSIGSTVLGLLGAKLQNKGRCKKRLNYLHGNRLLAAARREEGLVGDGGPD